MRGDGSGRLRVFTVRRTSSEPARASAFTCWVVPSMSAVSVLVIDCTTIGRAAADADRADADLHARDGGRCS